MRTYRCAKCGAETQIEEITQGEPILCSECGETITVFVSLSDFIKDKTCSFCSTKISKDEVSIVCPACQIHYHEECWKENKGCASYGCEMTGILDPAAKKAAAAAVPLPEGDYTKIPMPGGELKQQVDNFNQTWDDFWNKNGGNLHCKAMLHGIGYGILAALALYMLGVILIILAWIADWIGSCLCQNIKMILIAAVIIGAAIAVWNSWKSFKEEQEAEAQNQPKEQEEAEAQNQPKEQEEAEAQNLPKEQEEAEAQDQPQEQEKILE